MDAVLLFRATVGLVAFLLFSILWSSRPSNHGDKKKIQAPKPDGAWPILGHLPLIAGSDTAFRILADMADKYGPVFRIQLGLHNALVVSSKEAVKQIFTTNDANFLTRPKSLALKYMGYNGALFALAPYGPLWREMRKTSTFHLLSQSRLELLKPVRAMELTTCIKELYSVCCKNGVVDPVKYDMSTWLQQVIINVMIQMIASKRYSSIGEGEMEMESRRFRKAFDDFFALVGAFDMSNVVPFTEWMDLQGNRRAMKRTAKELDYFMTSWINDHNQRRTTQGSSNEDRDFIEVMISLFAESDGQTYGCNSVDVIKATVMTLVFAGADATSVTLTWALALLLRHKKVLQRVQQEIDVHVGNERFVVESDIRHLVYLQAVVKETLRLYPAAPLSLAREAIEDCTIAGYYVPKGTQLLVNIWKLHRDSGSWTDPDEFQPERFLSGPGGLDVRGPQFELIPFSSGRRSCQGMTAAMPMMHLTLARLLQGFDLCTPENEPVNMTEAAGLTFHRKYPLEVVLTPRLPKKLYHEAYSAMDSPVL
ncbi:Cytochrome P450, family 82, subfamily G, polypeptide 1 [Heracleum sosnowskyi]|uniref:Cytochrome P450, family 82, subfamily G, polypeptide 1 n=1 Tax=Heracleum sosnowskyi TaxID=360622 RepID=A0AAD8GWL5_9APIA|nr:Cytochrome P450, family 82, subfamily G, polypeptide 1 [Heracleum sosnowskyi]